MGPCVIFGPRRHKDSCGFGCCFQQPCAFLSLLVDAGEDWSLGVGGVDSVENLVIRCGVPVGKLLDKAVLPGQSAEGSSPKPL